MLVISRKENEAFRIEPAPGVDDTLTLREAFSHGPIVVRLVRVGGTRVRIAIASPPELKIRRESAQVGDDPQALDWNHTAESDVD